MSSSPANKSLEQIALKNPHTSIDVPKTGSPDGSLAAEGGVAGGWSFYIKHGKPTYEYNWFTQQCYKIVSSASVNPGKNVIKMDFKYDGGGVAKGGTVTPLHQRQKSWRGPCRQDRPRTLLRRRDLRHRPRLSLTR